jgi:hypothetical protein
MKKILRLVTTSVLTLTLVACGEASSSVASSTPTTSGSVSSQVSNFANVTSITISAASNTLKQLVGATQTVSVVAAINANTNPATPLEWYVNGVKTGQTGRIFEFVPTVVGDFKIQAKVGNTASNELTVNLAAPVFAVTSAAFVDASQIKIVAPAGAKVTLTGATLADTSVYDIALGAYILDLKAAVKQGDQVTVRLEREGSQTLNQVLTFDTRKLELTKLTYGGVTVKAGADGVFEIVRPFDVGAVYAKTYTLDLTATNILSATTNTEFKLENTAPVGAAPIANRNELIGATLSDPVFTVSSTTVLGVYTHKVTVGVKTLEIKVRVVEPQKEIEIVEDSYTNLTLATAITGLPAGDDGLRDLVTGEPIEFGISYGDLPLEQDSSGAFVVVKPFSTIAAVDSDLGGTRNLTNSLRFELLVTNFAKPEFGANTLSVAITGPSVNLGANATLFAGIEAGLQAHIDDNNTLLTDLQDVDFNGTLLSTGGAPETSGLFEVEQLIDKDTPVGTYTFTVSAGPIGSKTTKDIVVKVVAPTPTLDFFMDVYKSTQGGASGFVATRNHLIAKNGDTYTIEKPVAAGDTYNLEWFTLLKNWESQLVTDQTLISNDGLKTPSQREIFNSTMGVKDASSTGALIQGTADYLVGINTTANVIAVNVNQLFNRVLTANETHYKITINGSVDADFTSAIPNAANLAESAILPIPNDKIITIDTLTVGPNASINDRIEYTITVAKSDGTTNAATVTGFEVVATTIPNAIELGENLGAVSNNNYRFVNVGMAVTGPSDLIAATGSVKAAVLLGTGDNAIVLHSQTAVAVDNARARKALGLLSTDTTVSLDLQALDPYVDFNRDPSIAYDQFGYRRSTLPITNQTVSGTYNLVFTVDGLTRNVNIVINNPTPKVFVLSGTKTTDTGTVSTPVSESTNLNDYLFTVSSQKLKIYDAGFVSGSNEPTTAANNTYSADDKFVTSSNDVFTVEYPSVTTKYILYANIAVADLSIGAHQYKIVKTYPDGRSETVEDTAEVTDVDNNGIAIFSTTETIAAGTDNDKFLANFRIYEDNAMFVLQGVGTYKYEFTIGSTSRTFTINVVKRPNLTITGVKIGSSNLVLFDGEYVSAPVELTGAQAISIPFTKVNLTDADFFTVEAASLLGTDFVRPSLAPVSLKDLTAIDLGTLTGARSANEKIYVTLRFWNKVDYSELSTRYVQVGETENLIIGFNAGLVTTVSNFTFDAVATITASGATISIDNGATAATGKLLVLPSEEEAPTRDDIINADGTNGLLYFKANITLSENGSNITQAISGLQANRSYTYYVVAVTINDNISAVKSGTFSTVLATGFTSLAVAPSGGAITGDGDTLSGTVKYYLVATDPDITSTNITTGMTEAQLEAAGGLMDGAVEDFDGEPLTSADNSKFLVAVEYVNGIVARIGKVATGTIS